MLSRELGIRLTGRYLQLTLYHFSFKEFLLLKEFDELLEAMNRLKLSDSLILTYDMEDKVKVGTKTRYIKPAWKWLRDTFQV